MSKKLKTVGITALSVVLVSSFMAAPTTSAKIEKDLKKNTKDVAVTELQNLLKKEGVFDKNILTTGFFGSVTEKAVKDFQKKNGLPTTGVVDKATRNLINKEPKATAAEPAPANHAADVKEGAENKTNAAAQINATADSARIQELMNMIKVLQTRLAEAQAKIAEGALHQTQADTPQGTEADDVAKPVKGTVHVGTPEQLTAGVFIHGGVSGPGYPTGPLNISLPASTLLFDRPGTGSLVSGQLSDRQYEAPLETIPPTLGSFPFTFNGVTHTATSLKVISNLKGKNGVNQHSGTIDIDIDAGPNLGHLTLSYAGTATVTGSTVTSSGTFKTAGTQGVFAGLVAEGTYNMTITESGTTVGSPVTVTLSTVAP